MKPSHVRDAVQSLRQELYELARELVRHPSVTGNEDAAQEALAERLEAWGFDVDLWTVEASVRTHQAYCDDGLPVERKNLVATWGESEAAAPAALVLNGHIDVVPEGRREAWRFDPYSGVIEAGVLHGRGACDMKGGLAAAVFAVRAAMKLGLTPKRPVLVQSVVGEETGGLGTLAAILRGYRGDGVVITEPTGLSLCPVQAGALSFRLRVRGKAAHGAMRASGVSAIEKLPLVLDSLRALETQRHRSFSHALYREHSLVAPLSVGKVVAGNWPSTVPEELVAEGRYGVFPGEDCADARRQFDNAIEKASRSDAWLEKHPVTVEWVEGQFEPGETAPGAPLLETLATCHLEMLGSAPTSHGVTYGSDLRLFTRYAGMSAVLYGPGDVRLAHATNESVSLEEVSRAAEVLALLVARCIDRSGSC